MLNRLTPDLSTPSIRFFALRADVPATITASEAGLSGGWRRSLNGQPLATGFTSLSFSNLAAVNSAHSAGGLIVLDAATGEHRLDLPSTAVAAGADAVGLQLSATDSTLVFVVPPITVDETVQTRGAAADQATIKAVTDALGSTAASRLKLSAEQIIPGTIDNSVHTPTTTEFEADDITEATAEHYYRRLVLFTSGSLAGQVTEIVDYQLVGSNGHFTVAALTEAPANNDTFILI